ncbi:pilus assembly protein [Cellulomonas rhizosphaerae]|uniref:Pilus assembly protein n=1 Tax=Cellulomonas rhizosphaerae TaxID=2293719 RepID=A0A413RK99_9CELL|nr:pilus assembly protein [Cellulomonas rhizosphaerae]RHA39518.1 pilus assembly protein [Cellulomonas rhizosphaerae]
MSRWERPQGDEGSAIIEFLGVSLVLLVPLVYLVLVLAKIEAATFAVEGAAREAARVYVRSDSADEGSQAAVASVGIALQDQGFTDDPAQALTLVCSDDPCLTPGGDVEADVRIQVPLPFVPGFVRDVVPLEVPVSAARSAPVDEYRAGG